MKCGQPVAGRLGLFGIAVGGFSTSMTLVNSGYVGNDFCGVESRLRLWTAYTQKDAVVVVFLLPVGDTEILDNRVQYPDRRLKGLDGAIVVA